MSRRVANVKMEKKEKIFCLNCKRAVEKEKYFEIFDKIGVESKLDELLLKFFKLDVKKNVSKKQVICNPCLDRLIIMYDEDEYKKEIMEKAAVAKKKQHKKKHPNNKASSSAVNKRNGKDAKTTKAAPKENGVVQGTAIPHYDIVKFNNDKTVSLRNGFEFIICAERDDDDGELPGPDEIEDGFVCIQHGELPNDEC